MQHLKLMIPGPIEVEDEVLEQMGGPVQAHYGDAWVAVHNETIGLLQQVIGTTGKVFMLPGSGSLAGDAIIHTLFAPGERVAVGINGHFGHRWLEIMQSNGLDAVVLEVPPDQPLDPAAFDRLLAEDKTISALVVVHLETSTAVLNPIHELAAVCRKYDRLFVVDAVSSLAGTPLEMDAWDIDVLASGSQKGLGGEAGLGIVAINDRAWDMLLRQPERPRSWYLDLRRWQWYAENWGDWHPFPVTMPCSVILGLRAALQSLVADGLGARLQRYQRVAARLRSGLEALGLKMFVQAALMSPVLTAAYCPQGIDSADIIRYLAEEHQIKITAGFGSYKPSVIRIGHMGAVIDEADIDELLSALREFLAQRVS
jgi:alanine-glyoxylate transaminase/serine-glyoxylate transaminase/serine-pyruvate transaminase